MKRLLYLGSVIVLVTSFLLVGGRTYAAHQAKSANAVTSIRLCSSAPLGVPALHHLVQGIFNGVILATERWRPKFAALHIRLLNPMTMDDARADGVTYDPNHERQNALQCAQQANTFGYVGTLNSGAAAVSEPVLNRAGMVMISPANSGVVLTDPHTRAAQEPLSYTHRLKYTTYYRVVTTDNLQGPADAAFVKNNLHANKYFLVDDKQTYGAGLAHSMDAYARTHLGMTRVGIGHIDPTSSDSIATSSDAIADQIVSKHPDAVFYGGDSETGLVLPKDLRKKGYTGPVMGGDAIVNGDWIKKGGRGTVNNYATLFGPDVSVVARPFRNSYVRRFHTELDAYDAPAWDAANIELQAIYRAARAKSLRGSMLKMRSSVLPYVRYVRWQGAIGVTTFDRNGDTFNRILSVYTVKGNSWAFVTTAPRVPGVNPTP